MYRSLVFIVCSLFSFIQLFAQRTIVGKVTDDLGEPLQGAIIQIKGTDSTTWADENGFYQVHISEKWNKDEQVLAFSYLGTKTKTVKIKNKDTINVRLEAEEPPSPVVFAHCYRYRGDRSLQANKAPRTIVGKVSDCEGEPLPGTLIIIKGTNFGTETDVNGDYEINIPEERNTYTQALLFDYMGMQTKTVNIEKEDTINIKMEEGPVTCEFYGIEVYK